MFLKQLDIHNGDGLIRSIKFHLGLNLIVDETDSENHKESGNNVGKTTVLRLIDFCLGGEGKNIYKDPEFGNKSNTEIESFLTQNEIVITLILKEDLELESSEEIKIRRNFLKYSSKIQEIDDEPITDNKKFQHRLKELIFNSSQKKPSFRQIISKNIRDEKNKLTNTVKVLHNSVTKEQYEALYLFWLGINLDDADRKQKILAQKKIEENLQRRLRRDFNLSQIQQSQIVLQRNILELEEKKNSFNLNENYREDLSRLDEIKSRINNVSGNLNRLNLRRELIIESKNDLEKNKSDIDTERIKNLYSHAKVLIPNLQKTFEQTLSFHNKMVEEKVKYITEELPQINQEIEVLEKRLSSLIKKEKSLSSQLRKAGALEDLEKIIGELNIAYERKGSLDEKQSLWENSIKKIDSLDSELELINQGISSKEELIEQRVAEFNQYFSDISNKLYGELFILSTDKTERAYELNISSISGNLGTGKKKGQIAAFDLAYIQFADSEGIECLHFILHDQIETVHGNQILNLINEVIGDINCQYIAPILKDKLPNELDFSDYIILMLSQDDKLFKI